MIGPISALVVAFVLGVTIKLTHCHRDPVDFSPESDRQLRRVDAEHARLRSMANRGRA